jgi:integrase
MNGEKKERRSWKRGAGAVKLHHGAWYIRFTYGGKRKEERTNAKTEREARRILRNRLTDADRGDYLPEAAKTRVRELFEDMRRDYAINGKRETDLKKRWKHLEPVFGGDLAAGVTTARIRKYVVERSAEKAAPATVKLELAALRRMFQLGYEGEKVLRVPNFPTITVSNTRACFFEQDAFARMHAELPEYLRPLATVGYWLGWRKGELLALQWRQVDLDRGTVSLDAGTTKNDDARLAFLPAEAFQTLKKWRERTTELEHERGAIIRHVFHNDGRPLRSIDASWRSACKRAGVPGMLFHDLRRTAARNYVRSGNHESVVMKIGGWKTRSMFDRYNITNEEDLQQAALKVVSASRIGTVMGPITDLADRRKKRRAR